jgi:hypothetical protein
MPCRAIKFIPIMYGVQAPFLSLLIQPPLGHAIPRVRRRNLTP